MKRRVTQAITLVASIAVVSGVLGTATPSVSASTGGGHDLSPGTRFYVPPPAQGSVQQILQLIESGQFKDAGLIAAMESVPSAVWLDGETPAQAAEPGNLGWEQADFDVAQQVRQTLFAARLQNAVPIFVAYNIPGRDCSQYSAGGAPSDAAYDAWIDSIGNALGDAKARGARRAGRSGQPSGLLRPRLRDRVPRYHQHHAGRRHPLCGGHARERPQHQPLPRCGEQRLAERRRDGRDAGRRGRPRGAGLLPQRLQLPVRHQQRLLRHLGVLVHRLRHRERGPDPG